MRSASSLRRPGKKWGAEKMNEVMELVLSASFGFSVLRLTTPILLAALASVISERVGVGNITMEGTMLISAFTGVVVSAYSGSAWLGFLAGVLAGALSGYVLAYIIFKLQVDDILAGIAVNLLGSGGTVFFLFALTGVRGISTSLSSKVMPSMDIPLIKDIPVLGEIVSGHNIITYLSFLAVFVIWYLLFRTPLGLRIRSVGENPDAAKSVGVNVYKTKSIALTIAGVLSGMGGVYMSMGYVSWFARDMIAGRGFFALAAQQLGQGTTMGTFGSALIFGMADSLANNLQALQMPPEFVQSIPYAVTILGLVVFSVLQRRKELKRMKQAVSKEG